LDRGIGGSGTITAGLESGQGQFNLLIVSHCANFTLLLIFFIKVPYNDVEGMEEWVDGYWERSNK
jgi:hypothetical protein